MAKESAEEKLMKMMQKSASSVAVKPSATGFRQKEIQILFQYRHFKYAFIFRDHCLHRRFGVYEMRSGFSLLNQAVEFPPESKTDVSLSDIALPSTPSADYYLQKINERNIFKPYVPKVATKAAVQGLVATDVQV